MKYLVIFQQDDSTQIYLKDDLTPDQEELISKCNGFFQNNSNEEDIEAVLDDLCGAIFEGEWADDLIFDSDTDEGDDPYEINAPAIGLKVILTGSKS